MNMQYMNQKPLVTSEVQRESQQVKAVEGLVPHPTIKALYRHLYSRHVGCRKQDPLAERERRINEINACIEDGKIAQYKNGMDCDCVKFSSCRIITAIAAGLIVRYEDDSYKWADGPLNVSYGKPSEVKEEYSESRDLIAEAHEDGHPHVVYA